VLEEQGEIQNSSFNDMMLSIVQHNFNTNRMQTKLWGLTDNHKVKERQKLKESLTESIVDRRPQQRPTTTALHRKGPKLE
jgi:hypothetical protein